MKSLIITITNASNHEPEDIARQLEHLAARIRDSGSLGSLNYAIPLRDANGNAIGTMALRHALPKSDG